MNFRAKGRFRRGKMNKTEAAYADYLELRKRAGEIEWYDFERVTFKLGPDVRYTPDFIIMLPDEHLEMHEVKGFFRDDAKAKVRIAAGMLPFTFKLVRAIPKNQGGGWSTEEI